MSSRFTIVETTLNRAELRWKWLRFVRLSSMLGGITALVFLALGLGLRWEWITSKSTATALMTCILFLAFVAELVIMIVVAGDTPARGWLGAAIERVDSRLLDRLNALLYLEQRERDAHAQAFSARIARQLQEVTRQGAAPEAFSAKQAWIRFAGFVAVLSLTVFFYQHYSPWGHLNAVASARAAAAAAAQPESPLDLVLPATNSVEHVQPWGEVRITEPGRDLQVTKVDVVPLQIEAAANQSLDSVKWLSTINGQEEADHALPHPAEPRYAVYRPTIYLDELRLADWDVMTYYAKAATESKQSYGSEVYFLEVRPFREDILKLPGGEGGKCYQTLSELTALINRQQHVIRQTHQHLQQPPAQENLRLQDLGKLASAEADLAESTQHLYSQITAEMETQPIGEALDNLAKAEDSLQQAGKALEKDSMPEAQGLERSALSQLVAARKMFQKAITDNPDQFKDPSQEEPPPIADSAQKLSQMAEFRNEAAAAQQFMEKTIEEQKKLQQKTRLTPRNDYPKLANEQRQLQQSLQEFQEQHPKPFAGAEQESKEAKEAMKKSAENYDKRNVAASSTAEKAVQQLEKLNEAMEEQSLEKQMANAYKLKQMLDRQAETFGQCSKPGSGVSGAELQSTVDQARNTLNQLQKTAEQQPTRDHFGEPLRDALSGQNKADLEAKLSRLERPRRLEDVQDGTSKEQRAGEAAQALAKVSKAFEESQPGGLKLARQQDSLKPGEKNRLGQGIAELESLIAQLEKNRQLTPEDRAKQARQALDNVQSGARSDYGNNEATEVLLAKLDKMLKGEKPVEIEDLKMLLNQLQHLSSETAERLTKNEDQPAVSNIDPAKLPPAYRSRIQKYFQQLSEKP